MRPRMASCSKKKNRAAQEERVRRELLLERRPTVEECSG